MSRSNGPKIHNLWRGFLRKKAYRYALIIVTSILVITASALAGMYSGKSKQKSLSPARTVQSSLMQAIIDIDALYNTNQQTYMALPSLYTNARESIASAVELLQQTENTPAQQEAIALLKQQQELLETSESRYVAVSKPLAYSPLDDLGSDNAHDQETIKSRSESASLNLSRIAATDQQNTSVINEEGRQAMERMARCFMLIKESHDPNDFFETKKRCINNYEQMRTVLIHYIVDAYSTADQSHIQRLRTISGQY